MSKHRNDNVPVDAVEPDDLDERVGRILETRLGHFLDDIERRLGQTRELEAAMAFRGEGRSIHTEDLNLRTHMIDGYTVTANSPGAGSIAWTNVHIMYAGVDYTIADGNTANKYVWFVKPGSYTPGTPVTLSNSNTKPTLATGDTFVFLNNGGTPISVLDAGGQAGILQPLSVTSGDIVDSAIIATKIFDGAVGSTKIADDAVTNAKIGPGAVDSGELANNAVIATKIFDGAVGSTKIADDAVTNAKIGPGAVDNTELANNAVGSTKIADDAVTNAKIGPSAVDQTELATGAVTSTKIANGAVGTTQIANGGVVPSKLNALIHVMF